jgi:predicted dehydrogenase/catechol 2,3-dioxygenase-like lactoylglutathione lyase family enzyme
VSTYRVAMIGCRSRGLAQARAITQHPRLELVAICDLLPERLAAVGDQFGVAARYADFERMLREQEPDVVNIPTATRFHAPLAEAVLRLGYHVDVEKPLTLTLAELDRVLEAQRASGRHLVPHHQAAVHPPARKLREMVQRGDIGRPQAVRLRDKGYYGGFGILHQGCHALALLASVLGPARAVSAHMVTAGRPTTVDEVYRAPFDYGLTAGEQLTCLYELDGGVYVVNEEHYRPEVDSSTIRFEVVGTEGAGARPRRPLAPLPHRFAPLAPGADDLGGGAPLRDRAAPGGLRLRRRRGEGDGPLAGRRVGQRPGRGAEAGDQRDHRGGHDGDDPRRLRLPRPRPAHRSAPGRARPPPGRLAAPGGPPPARAGAGGLRRVDHLGARPGPLRRARRGAERVARAAGAGGSTMTATTGPRLGHLAIRARDAAATRRFYEEGLGLRFLGLRPSGTGSFDLSDGALNLTVVPYTGVHREELVEGNEHVHFGFLVADAVEAYERLQATGATFLRSDVKQRDAPAGPPGAGGSFKVADPDGNVVDVTGNPEEWRV